jgi:hypothetical protein
MNLRKVRICLLLYVAIDLLIGYAGVIPLSQAAAAQFTQVTGTVIDPNSIPYAFGTISATLVSSASPTLNGLPYTPPTQPTGLDQNGKFIMQLADNTALLPGATQWKFTVCSTIGTVQPSIGKGPVCFTAGPITISGTSQDITATLNAAALALTLSSGAGTTINPTNGVIPVRTNVTTFGDSPLSVSGGSVTDSGSFTANGTANSSTFNAITNTSQINSFLTATDTAAVADTGFNQITNVNPAGASAANFYSYFANLSTPAANVQNFSLGLTSFLSQIQHNGSGNLTYAGATPGLSSFVGSTLHNGTGTITQMNGFHATVNNLSSGTVTTETGFQGQTGFGLASTGAITTDMTFRAQVPGKVAGATMTHHYGFECDTGQTGGNGNADGWCLFGALTDKSQVGILSTGTPVTISAAANGNGVLALAGNTSGTATFTAPAVAGTSTNPITVSNQLAAPNSGYSFTNGSTVGLDFVTNNGGTLRLGAGSIGGFVNMAFSQAQGPVIRSDIPLMWNSTTNILGNITVDTNINRASAGVMCSGVGTSANDCTGAFGATLFQVPLTATAALTAGQVVKIDSANNNSVVVATTADTGGGIAIGIVANSPGAGATAQVVVSGNIATPLLGTGTCTKGQFVIVDTTTNGRVKCTGTYTAGTVIGINTVAQAAVGSALSVMVGLR